MTYIFGTATFGNRYGVANLAPTTFLQEPRILLESVRSQGIQTIDTAPAYGEAEKIIGDFQTENGQFRIHTKLSGKAATSTSAAIRSIKNSVNRLNVKKIEVLYFHSVETFLNNSKSENLNTLGEIEDSGFVDKIGMSVYSESEIERIALEWPQIKVFQVPENILDQRLMNSKIVADLSCLGKQFIVRSIFLQGLILMKSNEVPVKLSGATANLETLDQSIEKINLSRLDAAVSYLSLLKWASGYVIGAVNSEQLFQILNAKVRMLNPEDLPTPLAYPQIDPRTW